MRLLGKPLKLFLMAGLLIMPAWGIPAMISVFPPPVRQEVEIKAQEPTPEPCVVFAVAGTQKIYRCMDPETSALCIVQEQGIMQCDF